MLPYYAWTSCSTSWTSQGCLQGRSFRRARRTGLVCGTDAFTVGSADPTPGGSYLLLQRRAATKDTWPGYLDVTAAGHLASGEETVDGLREVEEELGLRIEPERLVPLGTRRVEQEIPDGCDRGAS